MAMGITDTTEVTTVMEVDTMEVTVTMVAGTAKGGTMVVAVDIMAEAVVTEENNILGSCSKYPFRYMEWN